MININYNLCILNDFTCIENMSLEMNFVNGLSTILHVGKYFRITLFCAIISPIKLFLVSICLVFP